MFCNNLFKTFGEEFNTDDHVGLLVMASLKVVKRKGANDYLILEDYHPLEYSEDNKEYYEVDDIEHVNSIIENLKKEKKSQVIDDNEEII